MARMIPLHSASSQAAIEQLAREIFEQRGLPAGRDLDHWLEAEADYFANRRQHQASPPPLSTRLEPSPVM